MCEQSAVQRNNEATKPKVPRQGTAVVEIAVCLPVLFIVIFGAIEACNLTFLKQTLTEAAYEGALLGSQPTVTESVVIQRVQTVLAARNITGYTVTVNTAGPSFDLLPAGERFTVHVDANTTGNIVGPSVVASLSSVEANVVGHKQ